MIIQKIIWQCDFTNYDLFDIFFTFFHDEIETNLYLYEISS